MVVGQNTIEKSIKNNLFRVILKLTIELIRTRKADDKNGKKHFSEELNICVAV